jgi:hypothetical protein
LLYRNKCRSRKVAVANGNGAALLAHPSLSLCSGAIIGLPSVND